MTTGKSAARRPGREGAKSHDGLADALGQAGWAEADEALAAVLAEWAVLERDCARLLRKRRASKTTVRIEDGMAQMRQALARAARRRGLEPFGAVSAKTAYESERHAIEGGAKRTPAKVRIQAPGVARGDAVLLRARVAPISKKKKRS